MPRPRLVYLKLERIDGSGYDSFNVEEGHYVINEYDEILAFSIEQHSDLEQAVHQAYQLTNYQTPERTPFEKVMAGLKSVTGGISGAATLGKAASARYRPIVTVGGMLIGAPLGAIAPNVKRYVTEHLRAGRKCYIDLDWNSPIYWGPAKI